jgi:ADP-ribosylglycohydrolase
VIRHHRTDRAASLHDRVRGCLLGGALGDQLGSGVEFLSLEEIRRRFGAAGVTGPSPAYGREAGRVTDDTQMTLFVAEGLVRAEAVRRERSAAADPLVPLAHAHLRWLHTQGAVAASVERGRVDGRIPSGDGPSAEPIVSGWLVTETWLHQARAPGRTCLSGLRALPRDPPVPARNGSKGCGGVMRVAPVGLARPPHAGPAALAYDIAGLTHGHPTGRIAAAGLAQIVSEVLAGRDFAEAIASASNVLRRWPGHEETLDAIDLAVVLARRSRTAGGPAPEAIEELLGGGWIAEEAIGIALCCAMIAEAGVEAGTAPDEAFRAGALRAVNHSGDSDSTGAIFGNLAGARFGDTALPPDWVSDLEGRATIEAVAEDLAAAFAPGWEEREPEIDEAIDPGRYPPW